MAHKDCCALTLKFGSSLLIFYGLFCHLALLKAKYNLYLYILNIFSHKIYQDMKSM